MVWIQALRFQSDQSVVPSAKMAQRFAGRGHLTRYVVPLRRLKGWGKGKQQSVLHDGT